MYQVWHCVQVVYKTNQADIHGSEFLLYVSVGLLGTKGTFILILSLNIGAWSEWMAFKTRP